MSAAQPPGRRTESLFDNRYRYDHIYPRGRSGETLRAYDTHDHNRPVVIKRPAPQDAPPMRAGQEVSIRTERQALERLSGHPVLTELRASGTFRVGGNTHDYIVMDLALGQIVESMVLELAQQNATLPELETLVIMDSLLDLLAHAHDKQVIYNDVDAKHLFWNRDTYALKVIDWGNAVFTDEPGAPPGINRATDVYQCGELLYFILTGGNRLAAETAEDDTFYVNFGPDAEHIASKLQAIVTRATHPDPKRRYGSILELRHALTEYRIPLERSRDEIIARVRKRVRTTASQEELAELADGLRVALDMDPGYPDAKALENDIQFHLRQIAIQADLDAIRIYLESANWPRALSLLHDLLPHADAVNEPLIRFLIAATATMENLHIAPPPNGFLDALDPLFQGDAQSAGHLLLTTPENRPAARESQWLLAEQLATLVTDVTLLRPHLVRLRRDLRSVNNTALTQLDEIDTGLDSPPMPGLTGLRVIYEQAETQLAQLEATLETLALPQDQRESLIASAQRARQAALDMGSRLDAVGHHIFGDPQHAAELLRHAALIDPTSPQFDMLHDYFDEVHQAITALAQFKPRGDGANLATWFADVDDFLQPYLNDLPDPQLQAAVEAIRRAGREWTTIINYLALGRRQPTIDALRATADTVRPFNEHIAAWMGTVANRLPDAAFVERHSPNESLASLLIDGWKAWDRGDMMQAATFGRQAVEQATTDGERLAADRLRRLGELLDNWLVNNGTHSVELTDQTEIETLTVLLTDEEQERRTFAEQMPNTGLYLRAMGRGIVAYMHQSSSAGWRALYAHYVLRGVLSMLENELSEAEFWRDAAGKTYDDARTHRPFQLLDKALTGRRLVQSAEQAFNAVKGPENLDDVRQAINAPLAAEWLTGTDPALQMITQALRDWSDGDFHSAHKALELAQEHIETAIQVAGFHIDPFVAWLTRLRDSAADLAQTRRFIEQNALSTNPEPDPELTEAHQHIVELTLNTLGPDYAHQVRQWNDMYQAVWDTYTTQRLTRHEKLSAFNRHFNSLFITKHPAYPLFRHWQELTEELPLDEIEQDVIEVDSVPYENGPVLAYLEDDREPEPDDRTEPRSGLPWNRIIIGAVAILIAAVALAAWRLSNDTTDPDVVGPLPTENVAPAIAPAKTTAPAVLQQPTDTLTPLPPTATLTPTPLPPTLAPSEVVPTEVLETPTPFVTSTLVPSSTPQPLPTAVVAARPTGDMLAGLADLLPEARSWDEGSFAPGEADAWILSANGSVTIEFPPDLLSQILQPGVASTLTRADAVMELVSYDEASLANGEVAFGLGAINTFDQSAIGQVQFLEPSFVSLGMNQNDQFRSRTEAPLQNPQITLSIRRADATTLGFYIDDKLLGDSVALFVQGEPITLILYATGKDVKVELSKFHIDFSPRSELP